MENSLFSGVPKFRQSTASLQCAGILEHLKTITFPFQTNRKLMVLGVPILKHFRVMQKLACAHVQTDTAFKIDRIYIFILILQRQ